MSLFAVLIVCSVVALVLWAPFRRPRGTAVAEGAGSATPPAFDAKPPEDMAIEGSAVLQDRLDERDRLFRAIADLRFDYESGKLSRADFDAEDAALRVRAAGVLRELDAPAADATPDGDRGA